MDTQSSHNIVTISQHQLEELDNEAIKMLFEGYDSDDDEASSSGDVHQRHRFLPDRPSAALITPGSSIGDVGEKMHHEAIKKLFEDSDEDGASTAGAIDPRILIGWPGARGALGGAAGAKKHDEESVHSRCDDDEKEEEEIREVDKSPAREIEIAGHDTNWNVFTPSFKDGDVLWKMSVRDRLDKNKKEEPQGGWGGARGRSGV
jgi:hypothetical protein